MPRKLRQKGVGTKGPRNTKPKSRNYSSAQGRQISTKLLRQEMKNKKNKNK